MKALYRTAALLLTLLSAVIVAVLVSVATDAGREIKVVGFALLALVAATALAGALALWSRTLDREGAPSGDRRRRR